LKQLENLHSTWVQFVHSAQSDWMPEGDKLHDTAGDYPYKELLTTRLPKRQLNFFKNFVNYEVKFNSENKRKVFVG